MTTAQVTTSDKRPCAVRSQLNLCHVYGRWIVDLVFAFPTHGVVPQYSHDFGRDHRRNRHLVLDRGGQFCPLHNFQTSLRLSSPLQSLPGFILRLKPPKRAADNQPTDT